MRRITWIFAIVMSLAVVVAGCGKKDAGSVVKQLDHVISKLGSYESTGTMRLSTGQEDQEYQVEVWFQDPHYYRISLTNAKKDITQIVLRNDDGVFVLTPHLNKSFRFQSNWPEKQGQVYLYQSLIQSIVDDNNRQFATDGGNYVFDVSANYQNSSLARQKIWLDKKDYAPKHVDVLDANSNVMVSVDFTTFKFDAKFDKDSFDMQRNMTSWNVKTLPTTAQPDGTDKAATGQATTAPQTKAPTTDAKASPSPSSKAGSGAPSASPKASGGAASASPKPTDGKSASVGDKATDSKASSTAAPNSSPNAAANGATGSKPADGKSPATGATGTNGTATDANKNGTAAPAANAGKTDAQTSKPTFGVIEPAYTPKGVKQSGISEVKLGENNGVMLRFTGTYNYTLQEFQPKEQETSVMQGTWTDLDYTVGVMLGTDMKTLIWTYDGIQYRLSSGELDQTEMVKIAKSLQDQIGK